MSSTRFSTLPTELICRVFEFADDFSVVAALAQTARVFYNTWRQYPTSICQAIAPRTITNLSDAQRLLDIQEEAQEEKGENHLQDVREQKPIVRARRLLFNTRCSSAAVDKWVSFFGSMEMYGDRGEERGEDPSIIKPSEIARFNHAFYCVWSIGVMASTPHLRPRAWSFLQECSIRELNGLMEFAEWSHNYNDNNFGSLKFDFEDGVWTAARDILWAYEKQREKTRRSPSIPVFLPDSEIAPVIFAAFFDHTQKYIDAKLHD